MDNTPIDISPAVILKKKVYREVFYKVLQESKVVIKNEMIINYYLKIMEMLIDEEQQKSSNYS